MSSAIGASAPPALAQQQKSPFAQIKPFLAPILITCILTVGEYWYGILESYTATGLAIAASIALELLLTRFATGRWPHLASAYITGISVGILVRSVFLWPYIVCSLLSISSKYVLRVKGRHLWNPSNLGVSVLLFLVPEAVAPLSQQWGNSPWPPLLILGIGSIILFTLGRLHITLTYLAAFIALTYVRGELAGTDWLIELSVLTSPSYQLFMIFMITDPKTTTCTWRRQCAVAVIVAIVETLLRLNREIHAPYYALFIVAPITNLLEIWWDSKKEPRTK
jgi:Na+-transporting NADH:ubiquinone oxidoreductase subunit NqrB